MDDEDDAPLSHAPSRLPSTPTPSPSPSPSPSSSPSPSRSPSRPPLPIIVVHPSDSPQRNGHASDIVTVASNAPQHQILTLALPIQHPPLSGGGGGGREDCWSEGATSSLINAWGERFVDLNRGSLKQKQWQEVAEVVSSREDYTKAPRTEAQCKNRIDTLKKKYKLEKAKIAAGGPSASSSWPFFHRLDVLLGPVTKPSPLPAAVLKQPSPAAVAAAARSHFPQKQRTHLPAKRKAPFPTAVASPPSSSDSFPPEAPPPLANGKQRVVPAAGMKELTRAILNFGEVYQRVESSKLQEAMEMERQRMGFASELEMQRIQFFTKTQMEFFRLKLHRPSTGSAGVGGSRNNHQPQIRRHHNQPPRNNISNSNQNSE